ncbi:hypothetical protein XVE_2885 [Xanthomonas vesicatoria ATCC 35937]|uniref:Uncharacterized protein n=1 Tax=Xanthomonas vesicatoria ATCC 35937 TaxID=925775 RepID=F0BFA1_9XANT|nr:hypothetical protein XVE_2885 [Xanthomonas vesicatoria ATCC 35937]
MRRPGRASTAAQCMHDLHHIALVQCVLGMPPARHDFAIDLHCHTPLCQPFLLEQGCQWQVVGKRTRGAVELNVHVIIVASRAVRTRVFALCGDAA